MLQTSSRRALHCRPGASQRYTATAAPYQKLRNAGELAKVVLVDVRRKLVKALNATRNQQQCAAPETVFPPCAAGTLSRLA